MRTLLVVLVALAGGASIVAALEALFRATSRLSVEPTPAPFVRRPPSVGLQQPFALVQLEQLVRQAESGQGAARARIVARLVAAGVPVARDATLAEVLDALAMRWPDVAVPKPGAAAAETHAPGSGARRTSSR